MDLTNEDVADILALLDSLPYDSLDLQTASFRLTLRRTPDGWTQDSQVLSEPVVLKVGGSLAGAEAAGNRQRCHIVAVITATTSHRCGRTVALLGLMRLTGLARKRSGQAGVSRRRAGTRPSLAGAARWIAGRFMG